ncbi:LacI family DNA-binding transcriptional regulator [Rhodococcoides trifolii]|nr:LacI family DNA-binding transcriptional regulator [Rhodococcus trifolii]
MADVARAAGVSPALVSIVMRGVGGASDETRARVLRIADELGYVPDRRAQQLRQTASRLIGVTFEVQQTFHGDLVEHLYAAAAERGYDVVISAVAPTRTEREALRTLLRERCEAIVMVGSRLSDNELHEIGSQLPAVVVARASGARDVSSVRSDDIAGVGLAIEHLVSLGHRDIVHIDGSDAPGSVDRRRGALDAGHRFGVDVRIVAGGPTEASGAAATRGLLAAGSLPSGVVAFNDRCAAGVLDTLIRAGVDVPGTVSVVGYDDSRLAELSYLQLTTVSQNASELSRSAIDTALALVSGLHPDPVVLTPRLVVRSTTGPVGAAV